MSLTVRTTTVLCKAVGYCFVWVGNALFRFEASCRYRWTHRTHVSVNPRVDTIVLLEQQEDDGPMWFYDTKPLVPSRSSISKREGRKWYAMRRGKKVGLFDSWEKCKTQVHEYRGSDYKSFWNINDALIYLQC